VSLTSELADLSSPLARYLARRFPIGELAADIEPYLRADGTKVWSLMQLERRLRPEAYGRRRGGYLD
jgi:hypothetical protein